MGGGGFCEHTNGLSDSITCWDIIEQLSDRRLLKEGSDQWGYLMLWEWKEPSNSGYYMTRTFLFKQVTKYCYGSKI